MILRQINGCSAGTCPSGGWSRIEPLPFCVSSCADLRPLLSSYSVIVELYIAGTGNVCGGNATCLFIPLAHTRAHTRIVYLSRAYSQISPRPGAAKKISLPREKRLMINRSAQSICRLYLPPPYPSPPLRSLPALTPSLTTPPRASPPWFISPFRRPGERASISLGSFINLRHLECLFSHFPLSPSPFPSPVSLFKCDTDAATAAERYRFYRAVHEFIGFFTGLRVLYIALYVS